MRELVFLLLGLVGGSVWTINILNWTGELGWY